MKKNFAFFFCMLGALTLPVLFTSCGDDDDDDDYSGSSSTTSHDYVDLGLSVKWATCNVGASSASDYGNYYAWGETSTKSTYIADNCSTYRKTLSSIAGNSKYDAARANWGGKWRLPTESEFQELVNKCTWSWTTQNGHSGYKITGPSGSSIFLPAAGWRYDTLDFTNERGFYMSATPDESDTRCNYDLFFNSSEIDYKNWTYRYGGDTVRPVMD